MLSCFLGYLPGRIAQRNKIISDPKYFNHVYKQRSRTCTAGDMPRNELLRDKGSVASIIPYTHCIARAAFMSLTDNSQGFATNESDTIEYRYNFTALAILYQMIFFKRFPSALYNDKVTVVLNVISFIRASIQFPQAMTGCMKPRVALRMYSGIHSVCLIQSTCLPYTQ